MKRQLFIEVFKQISSKIDQLKTLFNHHDAYYKVNTLIMCLKKNRISLFICFFSNEYKSIDFRWTMFV